MPTYVRYDLTPRQEVDSAGLPLTTAVLWFTNVGGNTPQTVYEDNAGASEHENPLEADANGRFAPVYGVVGESYRVRAFADNDLTGTPLWEDEEWEPAEPSDLTVGTSGAVVGLLSANLTFSGNNTFSGSLTFSGSAAFSGSVTMTGAVALPAAATADSQRIGWREIPITTKDANYTLVIGDAGKGFRKTGSSAVTITVPPNSAVAFPVGTTIYLRNFNATATISVARGSGVAMRLAGVATDADATIAVWGEATITQEAANVWVIRGTGIT